MNKVVLPLPVRGLKRKCAAEITDKAGKREIFGFARVKENAGYVIYECHQPEDGEKLISEPPFSSLIFARQWFVVGELPQTFTAGRQNYADCRHVAGRSGKGWRAAVEVADTNESKELMKFCRKYGAAARGFA